MSTVIKVENLSKQYRLGLVGASTFKEDTERWWARMLGKEDPFLKLGSENNRTIKDDAKFVWSLKDINFDVQQGDVLGIIGRNGAGKSTLLKILSKVTAPTTGSVKVKGRIASLLEVGTGFHPELTGRENIYLNGAILGMRKHEITRKLDEIIAFAGVEKYVDTPVKRYSSGMYVRLAFAVAAHLESEILILDEVLAVGDAEFQKKCLGKMGDVSKGEGRTVIFVSHNMAAVQSLCDKGLLLENGKLLSNDTINKIVKKYLESNQTTIDFKQDLHTSNKRLAGMHPILTQIELKNGNEENVCVFFQSDMIQIIIDYEAVDFESIAGAGFIIFTSDEIRVGGGNTYMTSLPPHVLPNKGKVIFQISPKQLTPGRYMVTVSLGSHQSVLIDKVEHCISFLIEPTDIYNSGYILTPEDGVLSFDFKTLVHEYHT